MTAIFKHLPKITSENGLNRYLQEIRKYPLLEPQYERELAMKWTKKKDIESAHIMVTSHLRLVAKIAMGFRVYGLPLVDLISEGNVGIMLAVKKFDPEKGFRLATYAMWWIKAQIQEYVLHSWSLVKIGTTAAQKKLFFNLKKLKNQLKAFNEGNLSPENVREISRKLEVKENEVIDMNNRLFNDQSLNTKINNETDGEWQDLLADENQTHDIFLEEQNLLKYRREILVKAMSELSEREKDIFTARKLIDTPKKLEELSKKYKVSRERIRQIEEKALKKISKHIQSRDV